MHSIRRNSIHCGHGAVPILASLLLLAALVLAGCGPSTPPTAPANGDEAHKAAPAADRLKPVKIGVVLSITGAASPQGTAARNVVELYRAQFAAVADRPVEWILYDDGSDIAATTAAVERVISQDAAAAVICCSDLRATAAIMPLVSAQQVPTLALTVLPPAAADDAVNDAADDWVFQIPPDDAVFVNALADHLETSGVSAVALLMADDARAAAAATALHRATTAKDIAIVAVQQFKSADDDLTGQLTAITSANPGALVVWAPPATAAAVLQQIKGLGWTAPVYQGYGDGIAVAAALSADWAAGVMVPVGKLTVAAALSDDDPQWSLLLAFREQYGNRFGLGNASGAAGYAHDAMLITMTALERAAAWGDRPGNHLSFRSQLRNSLAETFELPGVAGVFGYTDGRHGLDQRAAVIATLTGEGLWQPVE